MEMMILPIVDLKQIDCQIFLQPRWICSDHQRIVVWGLQPWGATCKSPKKKEDHFYRGEGRKDTGRTTVNKEFTAFHWLSPCQERRKVFPHPAGFCYCQRAGERPPDGLPTLFHWGFSLLIFLYYFIELIRVLNHINYINHLAQCLAHHEFSETTNYCSLFPCGYS